MRVKGTVIPDSAWVKFRYNDTFDNTIAANSDEVYTWRMNSLYDPDFTSTGGQPLGYDQWSVFFQRYCVFACKVSITIMSLDTCYGRYGILPLSNGAPPVAESNFFDQPNTTWKILRPTTTLGGNGGNIIKLKKFVNISKLHGRKIDQYDDGAIFGFNPETGAYLHLWQNNESGSTGNVRIWIRFTYYAKLFEKIVIPGSS